MQMQGIKDISVQSSVSLQHLPYNAELETALPKELQSRLAFAKQKVAEIAAAAKASPASSGVSLSKCQPPISEPQPLRLLFQLACALRLVAMAACHLAKVSLTDFLLVADKAMLCVKWGGNSDSTQLVCGT